MYDYLIGYNFCFILFKGTFRRAGGNLAFVVKSAAVQGTFKAVTSRCKLIIGMRATQQQGGVGTVFFFFKADVVIHVFRLNYLEIVISKQRNRYFYLVTGRIGFIHCQARST